MRTTVDTWIPNTVQCVGDICSPTRDDAVRYRVSVDRINVGWTYIGLYRSSDGQPLWHKWVWATLHPTAPGGRLTYRTDRFRCTGSPNAYLRVKGGSSGRWSSRQPVTTGCATL